MPTPDPSGASPRGAPATATLVVAPWWRWYAPAIAGGAFWLLVAGPARLLWPLRLSSVEAITLALAAAASWGILSLRRLHTRAQAALASAARAQDQQMAQRDGELRSTQERLRVAQQFNETILSGAQVGIVVYDRDLRYRVWSRFMEHMTGRPADQILGRTAEEVCPFLREQGIDQLHARALNRETVRSGDLRFQVPESGREGWFTGVYSPHLSADGEVMGVVATIHDITERRRAEEALRKSEEQYRTTIDAMGDMVHVVDRDLRFVLVNARFHSWCKELGLEAEPIGQSVLEFFSFLPDRARREYEQVFATGEALVTEEPLEVAGRKLITETRKIPILEQGRVARMVTVVRDVTRRRRAEHALRESEERYRRLVELSPDPVLVLQDGVCKFANSAFMQVFGYTQEDLDAGLSFLQLVREQDAAAVRQRYEDRLAGKELPQTYEVDLVVKDGRAVACETSAARIQHDGQPAALLTIRDITARKAAEDALRQSQALLSATVESLPFSFYAIGPDGRFALQNAVYKAMWGDCVGLRPEDVIAGETTLKAWLAKRSRARAGETVEDEVEYSVHGQLRSFHSILAPIRDGDETLGIVGVDIDVTERKQLEERLRQAHKMEAVGTLAAGIAHDFNNMMTPIMGYARFLEQGLPEGERLHRFAEMILKTATRAAALPRRLLAFSRQQSLKVERLDVNAVISDMNKMLVRIIGEDIAVQTRLEPGLHPIQGDATQLEQIILNLAVNAREAMPQGGRFCIGTQNVAEEEARRYAGADAPAGDSVCITVRDTGMGMDPHTLANIYEPYYTTKSMATNTGLGLSVAYGIVKQHGGTIAAESQPGKGSTFRVYFPAAPATEATAEPTRDEEPETTGHGECILFVEDEPIVRQFLSASLQDRGYTVLECATARMAIETFEREAERIELVFSDVMLPDSDALQLVGQLTQRKPTLKVLLTSGYTDNRSRAEAIRKRGYRFLPKPMLLPELLQTIRDILDAG